MKRKILSVLLTAMLLLSALGTISVGATDSANTASVYSGTPDMVFWESAIESEQTEIIITTADQLMGFATLTTGMTFEGYTIKLGADITINEGDNTAWKSTAPAHMWSCSTAHDFRFAGVFDGQGHTISGLYSKTEQECGLFGTVAAGAEIKNVKVVNSYFEFMLNENYNNCGMGGIAGRVDAGNVFVGKTSTIANCYVEAILYTSATSSQDVGHTGMGGIIGYVGNNFNEQNNTLNVENCTFVGSIEGYRFIGGVIGRLDCDGIANVKNCRVDADIVANVPGTTDTGAAMLVGSMARHSLNVENCLVEGTLKCTESTSKAGTLIGYIDAHGDDATKTLTIKNVLIASAPLANNGGKVYETVLFNTYLRKDVTCTLENIVYDSTLYARAVLDDHIKVFEYKGVTFGIGSASSFEATAKTTAELQGANGKALFETWTEVEGDYPTPTTPIAITESEGGFDASDVVPGNGNDNESGNQNDGTNETEDGNTNTETESTQSDDTEDTAEEGGCGSSVSMIGVVALISTLAGITLITSKKSRGEI